MALSSSTILSIIELTIYLPTILLTLYLLYLHRLPGILANIYLLVFLTLRLVASGLQISTAHASHPSTTGSIINSVGISPLLLALAGFLHESAYYLDAQAPKHKLLNIVLQAFFHIMTAGGVAIAAVGGSNLAQPETPSNSYATDHAMREAGSVMLFMVWILLCLYALWVRRLSSRNALSTSATTHFYTSTTRLLLFTTLSIPFVGMRALYGVVYAFDRSPSVNPTTGSFAIRFLLIFLTQLFAVACLVAGGVLSRHVFTEANGYTRTGNTGCQQEPRDAHRPRVKLGSCLDRGNMRCIRQGNNCVGRSGLRSALR